MWGVYKGKWVDHGVTYWHIWTYVEENGGTDKENRGFKGYFWWKPEETREIIDSPKTRWQIHRTLKQTDEQ